MRPKVLFTASTHSHILHFHLPYLQRFQSQGWTVHVACGGPPAEIPYADETLALPFEKTMWSPGNFKAAGILRRKIGEEGYTFLSTHTSLAAFFTRLALLGIPRRPLVANMVHGYLFDEETPYWKRKLLLAAEQWMASRTDLLLTMNRWDLETARKYKLGKTIVPIPGIGVAFSEADPQSSRAMRASHQLPPDAFVLLYAAEFSKRKSQPVLIRAMTALPDDVILVLAGDGAQRAACQALARRLGVADRVVFPGYLQDMALWYGMADAAVSSSRSEGLPFNVMEAMHAGLPVVASAVKGHEDLIQQGENGLLYPYGDSTACAAQIQKLLDSAQLRKMLGEQARKSVAQYSLEQVLPVVWAQYEGLMAKCVAA